MFIILHVPIYDKDRLRLVICKENYTLPSKELLLKDADMNVFHDTPWFEELIASLG